MGPNRRVEVAASERLRTANGAEISEARRPIFLFVSAAPRGKVYTEHPRGKIFDVYVHVDASVARCVIDSELPKSAGAPDCRLSLARRHGREGEEAASTFRDVDRVAKMGHLRKPLVSR